MSVLRWLWWLGSPSSPLPVLALGALAMFAVQLDRTIHDVDIFWQVKLGELTLHSGLPSNEPLLAGKEREPLAVVAWLGQVIYASVRMLGGWPLLRVVDAAIWFGGFVVVAWHCARKSGNDWPALAGLWVGWIAAIVHASLRPQSFAVLCFGLLIVLVRSDLSARRKLILGSLLLVLWQNLHPSVVIAIGYLGAHALADFILRRRLGINALLTLIAALATILTPVGVGIFAISKYNEEISKHREITEWLPMWGGSWFGWLEYGRKEAWISFAITPVIIALAMLIRRLPTWTGMTSNVTKPTSEVEPRLGDIIAVLGLTILSLWMHRFVLMWAVAVIPLIADALALTCHSAAARPLRRIFTAIVVALALLIAIVSPCCFEAKTYPFKAVDSLRANDVRGPIYCNYLFGGVLADAGYKACHDGRYYLFTIDQWATYDRTARGEVSIDAVLARHDPVAFVLRMDYDAGLIALLRTRWRVLFEDEDEKSVVFVR